LAFVKEPNNVNVNDVVKEKGCVRISLAKGFKTRHCFGQDVPHFYPASRFPRFAKGGCHNNFRKAFVHQSAANQRMPNVVVGLREIAISNVDRQSPLYVFFD
jgi:hypothetical protein